MFQDSMNGDVRKGCTRSRSLRRLREPEARISVSPDLSSACFFRINETHFLHQRSFKACSMINKPVELHMAGGGSNFLRVEYSTSHWCARVAGQPQTATVQPFKAGVLIPWTTKEPTVAGGMQLQQIYRFG